MGPSQPALDEIKRRLYEEGVSVADWAREKGFDVHLVYGVLSGRLKARRGESHRIAVALGLKGKPAPAVAAENSSHRDLEQVASDARKEVLMTK